MTERVAASNHIAALQQSGFGSKVSHHEVFMPHISAPCLATLDKTRSSPRHGWQLNASEDANILRYDTVCGVWNTITTTCHKLPEPSQGIDQVFTTIASKLSTTDRSAVTFALSNGDYQQLAGWERQHIQDVYTADHLTLIRQSSRRINDWQLAKPIKRARSHRTHRVSQGDQTVVPTTTICTKPIVQVPLQIYPVLYARCVAVTNSSGQPKSVGDPYTLHLKHEHIHPFTRAQFDLK